MGRVFKSIDNSLKDWLENQPVFFVATAPTGSDGYVNVSPKGGSGVFRVTGPTQVAYVDLVGSGAETIAHLRANGRIVLMFCAFDGAPKIIRLHGVGRVFEPASAEFERLSATFDAYRSHQTLSRTIISVEVTRISDSCGFVVPRMQFVSHRDQLERWGQNQAKRHGDTWKSRYVRANNQTSIDGLLAISATDDLTIVDDETFSSQGRAL